MWKKWFNNQAMNRMEARLRSATVPGRAIRGDVRYDFREIGAKDVNTRAMRYEPGFQSR